MSGCEGLTAPRTSQSTGTFCLGMSLVYSPCSSRFATHSPVPGTEQHPERPEGSLVKVQNAAQGWEGSRQMDGEASCCALARSRLQIHLLKFNFFLKASAVGESCPWLHYPRVTHCQQQVSSSLLQRGLSQPPSTPPLPGNSQSLILQQSLFFFALTEPVFSNKQDPAACEQPLWDV